MVCNYENKEKCESLIKWPPDSIPQKECKDNQTINYNFEYAKYPNLKISSPADMYVWDISNKFITKKAKPPLLGNSAFYVKTVSISPPSIGMGST